MNILDEISTRFSRRKFAKTAALSLFSAPALAALAACNRNPTRNPPTLNPTPTPTPKGQFVPPARPPIIIRGGSFNILVPAAFSATDPNSNLPNLPAYEYKFQPNYSQQGESIKVVNDGLDILLSYPNLQQLDNWELKFWVQTVCASGAFDPNPDVSLKPQFALRGVNGATPATTLFAPVSTASSQDAVYIGNYGTETQYRFGAYNGKSFRLFQVKLTPSSGREVTIPLNDLINGCHIFLYLAGSAPPVTAPSPCATP